MLEMSVTVTSVENIARSKEINDYVLKKHEMKVSLLYISQIKKKCGIGERENYNISKKENAHVPICPPEKEKAIRDALQHFQMILGQKNRTDESIFEKRCFFFERFYLESERLRYNRR